MKIETKYNIGDEVWFIFDNKVQKSKIHQIIINLGRPSMGYYDTEIDTSLKKIEYIASTDTTYNSSFDEQSVFATKEELLNSL